MSSKPCKLLVHKTRKTETVVQKSNISHKGSEFAWNYIYSLKIASSHKEKKKQTYICVSDIYYFGKDTEEDSKMCNNFSEV
jgi:hypothetical protein